MEGELVWRESRGKLPIMRGKHHRHLYHNWFNVGRWSLYRGPNVLLGYTEMKGPSEKRTTSLPSTTSLQRTNG